MYKVVLTALLMISVQVAFSQSRKIKTTDIQTEIFCDHCAVCESCDHNIFMKVKANTKGVRSVKVDAEQNIITLKYNSKKTNLEEIEKAILLSGYKANSNDPTTETYDKLDACCKKQ